VQGKNYAVERRLLEEIGGFGKYTMQWGGGVDSDFFWKCFQALAPDTDGWNKACFAGDIVQLDLGVHRRVDCVGDRETCVREFIEMHGVHPHDNPSRDKCLWVDEFPGTRWFGELPFQLNNILHRPVRAGHKLQNFLREATKLR
jgi:hypothetical protein